MKIMKKCKILKTVKIWLKMIKISKIDDTRHLTGIAEKKGQNGLKMAQNGVFGQKGRKGQKRQKIVKKG